MNKVLLDIEARQANLRGAEILYSAVKETYGPVSGNVGILRKHALPIVTHDGVTVAKSIDLKGDHRIGADLIKQAAVKMDDRLGDGTTTVTILAYHILEEACTRAMLGENTMVMRRQLIDDAHKVLEKLPEFSEKADTQEKLSQIATISAGDREIGEMVGEVIHKIGDGVVTVEESQGLDTTSEIIEGYTFDKGFASPYMMQDPSRMETVLTAPYIHVTDEKLTTLVQISRILEKLQGKKELLIICDDVKEEALSSLILARTRAGLNVVAVKAPSYADNRKEILKDISSLVGGEVSQEVTFGSADKVVVTDDKTTIIGAQGDAKERIKQLKTLIKSQDSEYKKEQLNKRISDLEGKVAVIKVGGASEAEMEEKKFRVDDAVYATKASLDGGTVPGGAVTYLQLSNLLEEGSILKKALLQPIRVLLENANIPKVTGLDKGMGINVLTGELVNLRSEGIIDPTKTIREAILNAVSVAGVSMTMKALVVEDEDEDSSDTDS